MKKCFKCGAEKPLSEYYRHSEMADGHLNKCKSCAKADVRRHRHTNESVRAYDRERAKTPKRKAKSCEFSRRWRDAHPEAYRAHSAVNYAVRTGTLKKLPCLFCNDTRVHAHHRDYSKPLEVIWLCAKCHNRLHASFPETEAHDKAA